MIRFFITLFFALLIGFGAKGQYVYSYTGVTAPVWNNDNRKIEININVTLDSIFNNGGTHYGIYFSYNITFRHHGVDIDRKSTRLNSSHVRISYAVFCLKKKKNERCRKDEQIV